MLQYFQTWQLKLVAKSWCLQQGLNVSYIKTAICESSWDLSLPWKSVRKSRGICAEELTERLERPVGKALACSIQEATILLPSLWSAVCLLADAFISLTLCLAHLNKKSLGWPLLKASQYSSLVSISINVMCLTFKFHGHTNYTLWKKKGLITVLDHCHSILASGTEPQLVALRPVLYRIVRGCTLMRQWSEEKQS